MHMYLYVWHSVRMNHKNDRTVRLNLECWKPVRLRTTKWKPIPRKLSLNVEITLFDRCFFVLLCFAFLLRFVMIRLSITVWFFPILFGLFEFIASSHRQHKLSLCVWKKRISIEVSSFRDLPFNKEAAEKNNSTYKIYSWNRLMQKRRWKADHLAACTPIHTNTRHANES